MTPESLVAELCDRGVTIEAAGGELRLGAPPGAMTPDLLTAVKSFKCELLKLLAEPTDVAPTPGAALLPHGPGVGEQLLADARTVPDAAEYSTMQAPSKADVEFARFAAVAETMPGGGWYDPVHGSPQMPSGVRGEDWRRFERDCAHLGKRRD